MKRLDMVRPNEAVRAFIKTIMTAMTKCKMRDVECPLIRIGATIETQIVQTTVTLTPG